MATIADVAKMAGVSLATASRALSGGDQVAAATRQRVLEAAEALSYTPNRVAQALAKGRSRTIGVLAPMADSPSVAERLRGLAARLAPSSYDLTLFNVETDDERAHLITELTEPGRVGAVVVISLLLTDEELAAFRSSETPIVAVDAHIPEIDCVFIDNDAGGRLAASELLSSGHRRIAFVGDDEDHPFGFDSSRLRRTSFLDALASASIVTPDEYVKLGPHGAGVARDLARQLLALPEPPTAIFAASDVQAMGVLEACREADVSVPRELSVVGFDDIHAAQSIGLSTIRQPLEESGSIGAKLIVEAIEHQPAGIAMELPLSFVTRSSSGPPPTG